MGLILQSDLEFSASVIWRQGSGLMYLLFGIWDSLFGICCNVFGIFENCIW